jgi:hypothetical protein
MSETGKQSMIHTGGAQVSLRWQVKGVRLSKASPGRPGRCVQGLRKQDPRRPQF